eukprot:RCo041313
MPSQFTFNGDVVVGSKRPLWNPIINRNRNEVGKPKFNSNKHVEQADRTYGTLVKRDAEGAGQIIFNWKPTPEPRREIDHGRDFIKLNKMSVTAGAAKPDQVSSFRSENDARIISRPGDILRLKNQVPVNIDRNKVYGTASEVQDFSMSELVRHKFEDEWIKEQLAKEESERKRKEKKDALRRASPMRVRAQPVSYAYYTHPRPGGASDDDLGSSPTDAARALAGRRSAADAFHMKKFTKVQSRLATLGLIGSPSAASPEAAKLGAESPAAQ